MNVVYCVIVCVQYALALSGQEWGLEWSGLVSMKPIGAGRIGGLADRRGNSLEFSQWVAGTCVFEYLCVFSKKIT